MTTRKRRHRTARKLVLPLIAVAMMTTMMVMESRERRSHQTQLAPVKVAPQAAARVPHDVRHR